jgi:hypothetical protein
MWWWLMHKPHGFLRWMRSTQQIILQIDQPQECTMTWPHIKSHLMSCQNYNICGSRVCYICAQT